MASCRPEPAIGVELAPAVLCPEPPAARMPWGVRFSASTVIGRMGLSGSNNAYCRRSQIDQQKIQGERSEQLLIEKRYSSVTCLSNITDQQNLHKPGQR